MGLEQPVAHNTGLMQRHRAAAGADAERAGRHAAFYPGLCTSANIRT
jgi:hypothetical protein